MVCYLVLPSWVLIIHGAVWCPLWVSSAGFRTLLTSKKAMHCTSCKLTWCIWGCETSWSSDCLRCPRCSLDYPCPSSSGTSSSELAVFMFNAFAAEGERTPEWVTCFTLRREFFLRIRLSAFRRVGDTSSSVFLSSSSPSEKTCSILRPLLHTFQRVSAAVHRFHSALWGWVSAWSCRSKNGYALLAGWVSALDLLLQVQHPFLLAHLVVPPHRNKSGP